MRLKYNPFQDAGITNYEQFKLYPFLIFGTLETINNKINEKINEVRGGYYFGERMILLGERGIGKTSSLFFIKDMLEESGIQVYYFTRLFEDIETIQARIKESIERKEGKWADVLLPEKMRELFKKPTYILIDFPDSVDTGVFKRFLIYLWDLMTRKEYNMVNLIFSMNKSHYDKSFSYSEIFGKFLSIKLDKLSQSETEKLIESRLKLVDAKTKEVFDKEVLEVIFSYSKGIPRNVISACSLLVSNALNGDSIKKEKAEEILKERYFDQVLLNRVEDLELRLIYKQMISILKKNFQGCADSQEDYIRKVQEITGIGRNSIANNIKSLVDFGIFTRYKGGYNRLNKIVSLN